MDLALIPARTILFREKEEPTAPVLACWHTRAVQVHHGQQGECFGRCADGMLRQLLREANGFVTKLQADRTLGV